MLVDIIMNAGSGRSGINSFFPSLFESVPLQKKAVTWSVVEVTMARCDYVSWHQLMATRRIVKALAGLTLNLALCSDLASSVSTSVGGRKGLRTMGSE